MAQPQGFNYFSNSQIPNRPPQMNLKGRPVSSIEEARAANIDFDGSTFLFPDVVNHKIYTKQINLDGTVSFCMYDQVPIPDPSSFNAANFITRDEFAEVINQLKQQLAPPVQEKPKINISQF